MCTRLECAYHTGLTSAESTHSIGLCCKTTCRRFLQANEGIFCANYLSKRGPFAPDQGAWCGPCYGPPRGSKHFLKRAHYDDDGRDPVKWKITNHKVLEYIRRANLDALWDRSVNTVSSNLSDAWRMEKMGERLGLGAMAAAIGPFPLKDDCGMRFAIAILERSLSPGQNEEFV
eukprot:scaffold44498_cov55-Attheya_sp.AAC.1